MTTTMDELQVKTCHIETTATAPDGSWSDQHISSAAADRITAGKVVHRRTITYEIPNATVVPASDEIHYMAEGAGTIAGLSYSITTAPTSSDTVTIDLLKAADGSSSFSTVLTSAVTINSGTTTSTRAAGTVNTAAYNQYDRFRLTVTSTGSTEAGLVVNVNMNENPS